MGLHVCEWTFFSCGELVGATFCCLVWTSLSWLLLLWRMGSRCMGFSSCSTWAQQLWCKDLAAPQNVGSSWTRDRTGVLCIARQSFNHGTTREALIGFLNAEIFTESLT